MRGTFAAMNASSFELVATYAGTEIARRCLAVGEYLLGREADCHLRFEDTAVSARHARLQLTESGAAIVEDLGSDNGTILNGQPISSATHWPPGVPLRIGNTLLSIGLGVEQPTMPASIYTPPSPSPIAQLDSGQSPPGGDAAIQRQLHLARRLAQSLELGREVARGGMGAVRTARESATRRTVAMKVMLRPENTADSIRFISEARITARLEHPNIVPIYDLGIDEEGNPFYTMKLVEGITLQRVLQLLKEGVAETVGRYPLATLLTIFQKLCDALAFAHARGVIHRDLKPANIMLGKYGEVLVMDWGLAKIVGPQGEQTEGEMGGTARAAFTDPSLEEEPEGSFNTHAGAILGTPHYMSPEQARGEIDDLDARSDIFVLGAILYEILTLERAFSGRSTAQIIVQVAEFTGELALAPQGHPRHLPEGAVPESLAAVVRKAMAPDKAQRYSNVGELQRDIEACQNGFATRAEKAGLRRQISLLIKRNKAVFSTLAAAWIVIVALALWFIINLHRSEQAAKRAAERALVEMDAARRAYAHSEITMADEAFRRSDVAAMVLALDSCPPEMRDQSWQYLSAKRDTSLGDFKLTGFEAPTDVVSLPGHPGQFALSNDRGDIALVQISPAKVLRTIKTGRPGIKRMAVSGDGRQIAVCRNVPAQVELYELDSGSQQKSFPLPGEVVSYCSLARDGGLLAAIVRSTGERMDLVLADTHTGAMRWKKNGQFGSVVIHPDGDRLAVTGNSRSRMFALLKAQDGSEICRLSTFAVSQAVSPDGKAVAVGTQTGDLLLLDAVSGAIYQRGKLHANGLRAIAWIPDGYLLTMGSEGKIRDGRWVFKLWNSSELTSVGTFFGLKSGAPGSWSFNPESGYLLTEETPPRLWRIPIGREMVKIPQTSEQGWSGCFLSDSVLLARKALALTRYDLSVPGKVNELGPMFPGNFSLAAAHWPSGLFAIARNVGSEPFGLRIIANQGANVIEKLNKPLNGRVHSLDFDAAGERIAVVFQGGAMLVYSVKNGDMLLKITGHYEHAVFAGGERNLVAVDARTLKADEIENDLVLLNGADGKTLATLTNRYRISALAVSPGRAIIATGGSDQSVHIYDAATLQERISYRAHDNEVDALAFHPSAPIIASASADGAVKLWDYRTGKLLDYFLGLSGPPAALAFSPSGRLLFVDGQEKVTHIYDVSQIKAP